MRGDACEMLQCLYSVHVVCDPPHPMLMHATDAVIE